MYSVHQHWDPLKVCIVGRSYSPEFYKFVNNTRVRTVLERIAQETEEDFQKLINLLESFNVEVWRPSLTNNHEDYIGIDGKIIPPPMTPRDHSAMIGSTFYINDQINDLYIGKKWDQVKGSDWPSNPPSSFTEYNLLPVSIQQEISTFNKNFNFLQQSVWHDIIKKINNTNSVVKNQNINSAETTRIGKDLYFGTHKNISELSEQLILRNNYSSMFTDYRCHIINTVGHADGTYCPVVPGLIVSLNDIPTYANTFPNWEVIYLPGQSWAKVRPFLELKEKNKGKWWVPGEELNEDFTNFVESWLDHWVGYVEETVFDVNMLVIDEKNVVCNNYNKDVFDAFEQRGITPHVINLRHRYFWDGGLHCCTSDIHREGDRKDYFPERG
jgi:hypothetical protein